MTSFPQSGFLSTGEASTDCLMLLASYVTVQNGLPMPVLVHRSPWTDGLGNQIIRRTALFAFCKHGTAETE